MLKQPNREDAKSILEAFFELPDPRTRACPHRWDELMFVALCGVVSGADGWVGVVQWAKFKLEWLKQHLPFANGIASHDTFSRVFNLLDAKEFEASFLRWMQGLCPTLAGQLIPIDGKSIRRSYSNDEAMLHLVSAWDSARGMVLGQIKTEAKSNEITAIPELIDVLDVKGATISIDAMGCQHSIVDKIIEKQGNYVIAVKDNQPSLARAIKDIFDQDKKTSKLESAVEVNKGHSRLETRRCVVSNDLKALGGLGQTWTGLKSVALIECTREVINGKHKGQRSTEQRYYISSLELDASQCNTLVRGHWGIENSLHWVLDVTFREDDSRIREGHGAENFATLRRIALNLFKQEKSGKSSVNIKRQKAGWSTEYLETILGLQPH